MKHIRSLWTRRRFSLGLPLAMAGVGSVASRPAAADSAPLSFLVVGDWGRDGASHQRDVASQMGRAARASGSRFVISTGDNFYEDGVQSAHDGQWKSSFEDVYTDPALQTPWYAVLGNHDYRGVPQAQIDYAASSPRWRMPSRYYQVVGESIGAPQVDMFFIDTSPLVHKYRENVHSAIARNVSSQDVDAQLAWLDGALAASKAAWKLVFGHHTIYSGGSEHGNTDELVQLVRPILERRGVRVYFNGHEHDLQHLRVGNVDYICSGAGSEVRPTSLVAGSKFALARSGFAIVQVDAAALNLEFRDFSGATVYRAALASASATASS